MPIDPKIPKRNFVLKETAFSGDKCKIYAIGDLDTRTFLIDNFQNENNDQNHAEVLSIFKRLNTIGKTTGIIDGYFKYDQYPGDDTICYVWAEPRRLRLYCSIVAENVLIIGTGAQKDVDAWQDDDVLTDAVYWMRRVSYELNKKIKSGEIRVTELGLESNERLKFIQDEKQD